MRLSIIILALILSFSTALAQQVRVLRAKDVVTGKWFQRVDSGDKSLVRFATEVAEQFGILISEVVVIEATMTAQERQKSTAEMAAGLHEGLGIIAAPPAVIIPSPTDNLRAAIRGANNIQELKRILAGDESGISGVNAGRK